MSDYIINTRVNVDEDVIKTSIDDGLRLNILKVNSDPEFPKADPSNDILFYDYDGTIVASWSLSDVSRMTSLPTPPVHEGLDFQEWNWTLEELKSLDGRGADVGAVYDTSDKKTRFYISLDEDYGLTVNLYIAKSTGGGDITINWGDGTSSSGLSNLSHTYSAYGDYVISIAVNDNTKFLLGSYPSSKNCLFGNHMNDLPAMIGFNRILKKANISSKIAGGYQYCLYGCTNLEELTVAKTEYAHVVTGYFTNIFSYDALNQNNKYILGDCNLLKALIIPRYTYSLSAFAVSGAVLRVLSFPGTSMGLEGNCIGTQDLLKRVMFPKTIFQFGYGYSISSYLPITAAYAETVGFPNEITESSRTTDFARFGKVVKKMIYPCEKVFSYLFYNLTLLEELILKNTVTIYSSGFYGLLSLRVLNFPASLETMQGSQCIDYCKNLKKIRFNSEEPPVLTASNSINNLPTTCVISVPTGTLGAYTSATNYPDPNTYTYIEED